MQHCAGSPLKAVIARATYVRPTGRVAASDEITTTLGALFAGSTEGLSRGDAIVAYAETLAAIARREVVSTEAQALVDETLATVAAAPGAATDPGLVEIRGLLERLREMIR